jgi:hypothetical protein
VAEALKRIESNLPQVTEEDLKNLKVRVEKDRKNRQQLESTWTEMEPEEEEDKLKQLVLKIDENMKVRDELLKDDKDIEELKQLLANRKTEVEASNEKVLVADAELQKLKALLDATPKREVKPAKVVNLPNPRPAPDNSEPRYFLVKYNKVYPVGDAYRHLFQVRDFIEANAEKLVYRGPGMGAYTYTIPTTKKNENGGADPLRDREERAFQKFRFDSKRIEEFFEKGSYGGDDITYRVKRSAPDQDYVALRIVPNEEGGWPVEVFKTQGSDFDNELKKTQVNRNYVVFMVAPDSFDAYLEARQMAEHYRVPAGWKPWTGDDFPVSPTVTRETVAYSLADLPLDLYKKFSGMLKPVVEKNLGTAEQQLATVTDPKAKEAAEQWAKRFSGYVSAVTNAAAIAEEMRGTETVLVSPGPPNIPHIRVFEADGSIPKKAPEPKPVAEKPPEKKTPPPKKRDMID